MIVGCIAAAIIAFPSAYGVVPLLLLSAAFCLIAGGNTLFGTLVHPVSRTLGEMAYSIYLLHGILLFVVFTFVVGREPAQGMSTETHWFLIVVTTPLLITGSYLTYRWIEHPAMQQTEPRRRRGCDRECQHRQSSAPWRVCRRRDSCCDSRRICHSRQMDKQLL